jgi:hypothetical protein
MRELPPTYVAYEMAYPSAVSATGSGIEPGVIRGVIVALELEPWGGAILPHEEVLGGPVQERLGLLRATATHLSPIYGTVAGPIEPLHAVLDDLAATTPVAEVIDDEGVRHRTWLLGAEVPLDGWLRDRPLLIADGHHRYTTALAYRDERRAENGPGPWDRVLTFVVDRSTQTIPVLPYHRVQRGGTPLGGGAVADRATAVAAIADEPPTVVSVTPGRDAPTFAVHRLRGAPPAVVALQHEPSGPAAGGSLSFTQDPDAAIAAVTDDGATAAYLLPPTTPERILSVVERGERLPPKSTFFWPKPRTGLVLMPLDGGGSAI